MSRAAPPAGLLQRLVAGPTSVSEALWFDRIGSTNVEAARRARSGAEAGLLVLTDEQTAGRGRRGRRWSAPAGTSLLGSLLLRPTRRLVDTALLPLLTGLALAEACQPFVPDARLGLKWPNDLLADGRKCAGILVEAPAPDVVVVGFGINVDWRGVARPPALADATSLSEVGRGPVDRWSLLPAVIERIDGRYGAWTSDPTGFLPAYRARCATLGELVRVDIVDGDPVVGTADRVTDAGALVVVGAGGRDVLHAGSVQHLRHR